MVRNVVLVKLAPDQDPAAAALAQQAFLDLSCPGTLSYAIGDDLGLRDGNWGFAIVADFGWRCTGRTFYGRGTRSQKVAQNCL